MFSIARELSWKSILAGLGVSLCVSILLSVVYTQLISWFTVQWLHSSSFTETTPIEVIASRSQEFMESARWIPGWLIVTFVTNFAAGYVAAHYAHRLEVLHGAIVGVIVGAAAFSLIHTPTIIISAVLGSMLWKRRKYAGI